MQPCRLNIMVTISQIFFFFFHEKVELFFCVQERTNELKVLIDKSFRSQRFFQGKSFLMGKKNNSKPKPFT